LALCRRNCTLAAFESEWATLASAALSASGRIGHPEEVLKDLCRGTRRTAQMPDDVRRMKRPRDDRKRRCRHDRKSVSGRADAGATSSCAKGMWEVVRTLQARRGHHI